MSKAVSLKLVNSCLFLFALFQAVTGMAHELIPYEVYKVIHLLGGLLFILFGIAHVVLNRAWIVGVFSRKKSPGA